MENHQESYSLHTVGDYRVFRLNEMALNLNLSPGYIDGSWHHVAATYGGATARVYVDGVARRQHAYSTPIASFGSKLVLCAYYSPTEAITQSMDEASIYISALSAARTQAHYQAGVYLYRRTNLRRLRSPRQEMSSAVDAVNDYGGGSGARLGEGTLHACRSNHPPDRLRPARP